MSEGLCEGTGSCGGLVNRRYSSKLSLGARGVAGGARSINQPGSDQNFDQDS